MVYLLARSSRAIALGAFFCTYLVSSAAFADKGIVIKEDICGYGKTLIGTSDGWFIAAEYYGGRSLYEGTIIFGDLKSFGFKDVFHEDGSESRLYIEDYEMNIENALEELCQ